MSGHTPGWRFLHIGFEHDGLKVMGLDLWTETWRPVGAPRIWVRHPSWPAQLHDLDIYEIGPSERLVRFAAGELSNGVWGVFVPE